jgi:enediyne biosynthesis protein E4
LDGGTFLDESGNALTAPPYDWGLSVMFRDFTGDGAPDLYVCNDFKSPDRIWVNDGRGRFRPLPALALRQTSLSSMGVDFGDLNRDGHDDFIVLDMLSRDHFHRLSQRIDIKPESLPIGAIANRPQGPRNTLFMARGDGTWAETARFSGLEATEWSWTPIFLDVDLDGYEDVLVSNGFTRDGMNMDVVARIEAIKKSKSMSSEEQLRLRTLFPKLETANLAFRNLGNMKFAESGREWGFNQQAISQGMCLADLDSDGDLDVVINNLNAPVSVLENKSTAPRLAVRLKGRAPNTHGIGARIVVRGGAVPMQSQEVIAGGRYLSADEPLRMFAAGALTNRLTVEVTWRNGRRSVRSGVKPNTLCEVDEATSELAPRPAVAAKPALFTDVSHLIKHTHHEEPFEDFSLQPTLPRRLSQSGPGVAWFDVDGDGWDDLLVGSGTGGNLAVFLNQTNGTFVPLTSAPLARKVTREQTTILGWRRDDGAARIIAGSANYEDGLASGSVARIYDLASATIDESLPGMEASAGPLAMADVDGDGILDLFVGGRVRAGHYPEAVDSLLFRSDGTAFALDSQSSNTFSTAGLVSGAVFTDLDNDGDPDLVLACDLGPVKIHRNDKGRFSAWDAPVVMPSSAGGPRRTLLSQMVGWWNGVTAGDFDGDGRMDLAASNWGRNTRYEGLGAQPLSVFHGALFPDAMAQVVEGYTETGTGRLLPLQPFHLMGAAMPALRERSGTFESYAKATLPEIYGDAWRGAREVRVTEVESMVFLNRGDHFVARRLPMEAALAPAFALVAADFDGDGQEDLFLSQNFFAVHPETSRYDAGRGLLLRGTGTGDFTPTPGQESGLLIYGEQRGAAAADFDADGRTDLVVAQNGNETRLFRNANARPGLRVRLKGTPGNSSGIGAQLRLVAGGQAGPAREIHAGSGYWSQDSAVAVLASPAKPESLQVRWPGGQVTTHALPDGAAEVQADAGGGLVVLRKTK